ncbi:MAG: hypothetical protein JJ872_01660 [Marivivens sp.]|nr:hypothetical protein [Marivivens sp.]
MVLAVPVWLMLSACLLLTVRCGLAQGRPALLSFALVLMLVSVPRPALLGLGLDTPMPDSHFGEIDWPLVTLALSVCLIWAVVVLASYALHARVAIVLAALLPRGDHIPPSPWRMTAVLLAPALLAVIGSAYLLIETGSLAAFVIASKVEKSLAGLFIIKEAARLVALLALFGFLALRPVSSRAGRWGRSLCLLFGIAMVACTLLWGARYDLLLMGVVAVLAWRFHVGRVTPLALLVWALALAAVAVILRQLRNELLGAGPSVDGPWRQISAGLHFVQFDALMLVLRDAGDVFPFRGGADFIHGLQSWIPRSLFPEKETFHIGPWFRRIYQPLARNGWPVTTPGAWYVNFGPLGIVLGAYLSGAVLRVFDAAFCQMKTSPWQAAIGAGLSVYMFEAGITTGFPQDIILLIVPLWAAALFLFGTRSSAPLGIPGTADAEVPIR